MMNYKNVIIFLAGVGVGIGGTYRYFKKKSELEIEHENNELYRYYHEKYDKPVKGGKIETPKNEVGNEECEYDYIPNEKPPIMEYSEIIRAASYDGNTEHVEETDDAEVLADGIPYDAPVAHEFPYIIYEDDFGALYGYESVFLYKYADGIIADEQDNIIDNAFEIFGEDNLRHFGEEKEGCLWIRNDLRKCDYEIVDDYRLYSDVIQNSPYRLGADIYSTE